MRVLLFLFLFLSLGFTSNAANDIYLGDSRTVMMYFAMHPNDANLSNTISRHDSNNNYWNAKSGSGLTYMRDTAFPAADSYVEAGSRVFIWFGTNDITNAQLTQNYIDIIDDYSSSWWERGATVYYLNVGPCREDYKHHNKVDVWNNSIAQNNNWKNCKYVDINSKLSKSWEFCDSVHYTSDCSKSIFEFTQSLGIHMQKTKKYARPYGGLY